jgi:hypothetical protein
VSSEKRGSQFFELYDDYKFHPEFDQDILKAKAGS